MKKLISILMSIVIFMTTFIILSAGNVAGALMPPEIYLLAQNQYYVAGEEITFDLKIPANVIKNVVYVQLLIDCNTEVLKYSTSDQSKGESSITQTEKGYKIEYYPWFMATNTDTFTATLTFRVSEGDIDVNAYALLQYRDSDTTREARLADDLPDNTVFSADEVPRLMIAGDIEIYRKEDTIYLPHPVTKSELKSKIRSTHKEYPIMYKPVGITDCEYALTNDEIYIMFDERKCETVRICIIGDADSNGIVTAADARKTLRYAAKIEMFPEFFNEGCDFNGNGVADASDARQILRVAAKLEEFKNPEITLFEGRKFVIDKLKNAGSGAYNWECTVSDESAFEITDTIAPPEGVEINPGTPFEQTFTFKALKAGTYTVHFELIRSWDDEPIKEFGFTVVVDGILQ